MERFGLRTKRFTVVAMCLQIPNLSSVRVVPGPLSVARWGLFTAAVVLGAAILFFPLSYTEHPAWDIWVTDQSGRPVEGITVRLTSRNYSAEYHSREDNAVTDGSGHAAFRARYTRSSLARRITVTLTSALAGIHASFGPHANVFAFGKNLQGFDIDQTRDVVVEWTGRPAHMESHIVVRPVK